MQQQDGHRISKLTDAGIYCPACKARVIQKGVDGKIKLRTSLLAIDPSTGQTKAVCKRCGEAVSVDIRAGEALIKAFSTPKLKL